MHKLPLEGIRVVDFTSVLVGPHCTQWLAVAGAEVIKIETSMRPDQMRTSFANSKAEPGLNRSATFAGVNYSKKSCTLNMTQPRAVELVKALVKVSDVVVENFGGPVMERWGLGYSELKKIKSDIIMVSGSGYGRTGPRKDLPAYASIIDAFSGLSVMNGYVGGAPLKVGSIGWTDMVASQYMVFATLAAIYHRSQTGVGQYIDHSMAEGSISMLAEAVMGYTMNGRVRGPEGNRDDIMAPHGCYRCKGEDKWVAVTVSDQEEWLALCNAIGKPEWTRRQEFSDELSRWKNQEELDKLLAEWTINHDHYEVMERLQKAGVMAGACLDVKELTSDPQLKERGYLVEMDRAETGKLRLVSLPCRLSDCPKGNYQSPPLIGEHNDYVFGELLGLPKEEIKQLKEEKVIY